MALPVYLYPEARATVADGAQAALTIFVPTDLLAP